VVDHNQPLKFSQVSHSIKDMMRMEEYKDPLIGRTIKSYRLTDKLGGGAFGAVYRAEHTRINKSFAVKVLHPHIASNEEVVKRFRREAQSLAALDHPNIVQIVDFDQNDEVGLFLILEWLKGEPLSKILKQETRLSIEQTENLFIQLLAALAEAHAQGIVHRDLKPAKHLSTMTTKS
jgi:serine/threonine-protein kinase